MNTRRVALTLLLLATWLVSWVGVSSAVTLPFYDDFENVSLGSYPVENGWKTWASGFTAYVSDTQAYSGIQSFRLHSYSYWPRCDFVYLDTVTDQLTYEVSVYMDPVAGRIASVGLAHGAAYQMLFHNSFSIYGGDGVVGLVYFEGDFDSPRLLVGEFPIGEWLTIGAELDFATQTASVWLNGEVAATGVPIQPQEFDDPVWGHVVLNRFAVAESSWIGGRTGVIYVDDVVILDSIVQSAVEADVDISPAKFNLKGRGRYLNCHIELPEGYSVLDIDVASLLLNGVVAPAPMPVSIGDYDYDGVPDMTVKFDRQAFLSTLSPGEQEVSVDGCLIDTTPLVGIDFVYLKP